jgi:hypothetical protein
MSEQFIYVVRPSRDTFPGDATDEERAVIGAHFKYLQDRLGKGVIFVGRTQTEHPFGICVFEAAGSTEAQGFLDDDPALIAGIFKGEVHPFAIALMKGPEVS